MFCVIGLVLVDPLKSKSSWDAMTQKLTIRNANTNEEEIIGLFEHVTVEVSADNKDFR